MALIVALGALPLTQGCQSGLDRFQVDLDEIGQLTRDRSYIEAAEKSVDLLEATPEDAPRFAEAVEAQRTVSLASQLDRARSLSLVGDDEEALEVLERLSVEYPDSSQVEGWRAHTRRKLADQWFSVAREALANETYEAAHAAYGRVLEYEPNHPVAGLSMEDLDRLTEYRAELSVEYYNKGVRGVVEQHPHRAYGDFGKSIKYAAENPKAKGRMVEVNRARALQRAETARSYVEDGLYSAAAKEYAAAVELDPDSAELQRNLEALRSEAKAQALLGKAEFQVLRGDIDKAEELLAEGAAMTALQSEAFAEATSGIGDARTELSYQGARALEDDFRFPEAIEAYDALLTTRDFYKDARARTDALHGYVASAARLYDEAAAAADDEKRLELLQQIDVFWPEYKNVAEQIRGLRK